jgi:YD repeat-containing protein
MKRLVFVTLLLNAAYAQVGIRSFYDDNGQLFRALDSTGNLVEYDYDAAGNPTQIRRSVVAPASLSILNLVPQRGGANTTVTIYGQNFSSLAAGDTVMFNGVAATVISASSTALVVSAPNGVTTGPVSVTVNGVTVTSGALNYTVPNSTSITSISPNFGFAGQTLTIQVQGSGLTGAGFAFQGGAIAVANVSVASDTQASFTATVGQLPGQFVLVARGYNGASSSTATSANTFHAFEPAGANYTLLNLSVFNANIPAGTNPYAPAGSNAQFLLFSTNNTDPGTQSVPHLSILPLPSTTGRASPGSAADGLAASGIQRLVAGQTVAVSLRSSGGFLPLLQFLVNGVALASSTSGYLDTYFTAPFNVTSLTLQATAQTVSGAQVESAPVEVMVSQDRGITISGRALDAFGRPLPGAALEWQANGLTAEYFPFSQPLNEVPDLTGLTPARTVYFSALNYPNPRQVFGQDPMGAGLGPNYAVRLHGRLNVPMAGGHGFQLNAQMGAQLSIDGSIVLDSSAAFRDTILTAGEHDLEVIYYNSGAAAAVQLLWTPPGEAQQIVPPSAFETTVSAGTAGSDSRFAVTVPGALTGVRMSLTKGTGSVVRDQ